MKTKRSIYTGLLKYSTSKFWCLRIFPRIKGSEGKFLKKVFRRRQGITCKEKEKYRGVRIMKEVLVKGSLGCQVIGIVEY